MALPVIDFRSFSVADIRECLENNGYLTADSEFDVAESGAFKYIGHSNGQFQYLMGFVDDCRDLVDDDEMYIVSRIFVNLNPRGKLIAEYSGYPAKHGNRAGIDEYINKTCN